MSQRVRCEIEIVELGDVADEESGATSVQTGEDALAMALADAIARCGVVRKDQIIAKVVELLTNYSNPLGVPFLGRQIETAVDEFVGAAQKVLEAWDDFDAGRAADGN